MKLLLDTCVWGPTAAALRAAGHDVVWVGDWIEDPGDEYIIAAAYSDERILVTLDKDFGELAVRQGAPHHGIVRLVGFRAKRQADVCLAVLTAHGDELFAGAIVTAERGRIRIRPPENPRTDETAALPIPVVSLKDDDVLSDNNWQQATFDAIEELPTDIRASIGHSPPTAQSVILNVSVEPLDKGETHLAKVEVTRWNSAEEIGWAKTMEGIFRHAGVSEDILRTPLITVGTESSPPKHGLLFGGTIDKLKREVQLMVLEQMWSGGRTFMVVKDSKGRFVRKDGSLILSWQFSET